MLVVLIIGAGIWSWSLSSFFLKRPNLLDLVTPYVFIGLLAFGLTFVVIAGEIDISVVSTMAVSAVCFAEIFGAGVNVWLAALAALGVAAVLGLLNGLLVGVLDLPSLAVTLGTLAAYRGLAYVILGGAGVARLSERFHEHRRRLHLERAARMRCSSSLGLAFVLGVLLHATRFGRYLYAIGANREAALYSGHSGHTGARDGVRTLRPDGRLSRRSSISATSAQSRRTPASGSELIDVVTAVVLGGVDIFGGSGSMLGVFLALVPRSPSFATECSSQI